MRGVYSNKLCKYVAISLTIIGFIGVYKWAPIPFLDRFSYRMLIDAFCFVIILYAATKCRWSNERRNLPVFFFFLLWMLYNGIKGISEIKDDTLLANYIGSFGGSIMLFVVPFIAKEEFLVQYFKFWKILGFPLFIVVLLFTKNTDAWGFYLCALQIYLILWKKLNTKTKIIIGGLTILVIVASYFGEGRSHILKYGFALLLGLVMNTNILSKLLLSRFWLTILHAVFMFLPVICLILAITGNFNIFRISEYIGNDKNGLYSDTRTTVYYETLTSALENDYVLMGRTPARGYDSMFQEVMDELNQRESTYANHSERNAEVGILNVFTWYGVIGVVLYFVFFYKITYRALFVSNNTIIKIISLYLCFRWFFCWIEDMQGLNSLNIVIWILMSFCYLNEYRYKTEDEMNKTIERINLNL